jgi:NDP-sugar pyrophosphorylase family protein
MKAIMLAAGEGTRCRPFTYLSPKIAQEVCGIPLLEYMLSWFGRAPEIKKLFIAVGNDSMADTLRNYLDERMPYLPKILNLFRRLGFQVESVNPNFEIEVIKARGWGTGADLRLTIDEITSREELGGDFLVCNADYVIVRRLSDGKLSPQLNLSDIIKYHRDCKKALNTVMTIAVVPVKREEAVRFGVAQLEQVKGFHLIHNFVEKPELDGVSQKPLINAGVYIMDGAFILYSLDEYLPEQPNTNLERTLLQELAKSEKLRLAAYLLDLEAWFDVGTLETLVDISVYLASRKGG